MACCLVGLMEGDVRTCWKGTICEEHLILKYAAYIICKFARMGFRMYGREGTSLFWGRFLPLLFVFDRLRQNFHCPVMIGGSLL